MVEAATEFDRLRGLQDELASVTSEKSDLESQWLALSEQLESQGR